MRSLILVLAGLMLLGAAGCMTVTDPLGHRDALEDAQKRYTDLIRWRDAERAAIFVDPEMRKDFLEQAEELENLEISDYELGTSSSATVTRLRRSTSRIEAIRSRT